MPLGDPQSLFSLENSASTSRLLNLRSVFLKNFEDNNYKDKPFFENPTLNRAFIIKHRLLRHEQEEFSRRKTIATKIVIPFETTNLGAGAQSVFVGQTNFEKMIFNNIHAYGLDNSRDLRVLSLLDSLHTLDPFILREHLAKNDVTPADCYFQLGDADVRRMFDFTENEIGELVKMSLGAEWTHEKGAIFIKKLLSSHEVSPLEGLRLTLQMDNAEFQEGIFCWKAFLYYKWQYKELSLKITPVMSEIDQVSLNGPVSLNYKSEIPAVRKKISRSLSQVIFSINATMSIYDNAYDALIRQNNPAVFKTFLLSAPKFFEQLSERLGALEHLVSFWRFRVPLDGSSRLSVDDLLDMFRDFESSLTSAMEEGDPAARKFA